MVVVAVMIVMIAVFVMVVMVAMDFEVNEWLCGTIGHLNLVSGGQKRQKWLPRASELHEGGWVLPSYLPFITL